MANGLGGPIAAFRPHIAQLKPHYRVLSWDYRGLYGSRLPPGPPELSVEAHARDVLALLDSAGVKSVVFVGWSMGVQIALELVRLAPSRVAGLVLMNGAAGRPLRAVDLPFSELVLRGILNRARAYPRLGQLALRRAGDLRSFEPWLKRLGIVAPAFDGTLFQSMLEDFKTIDLGHYFGALDALCEHDASDVLAGIDVPTLVISGGRDRLTPPTAARHMAGRIRGSEYFVVPRGTHYTAAEYPEVVTARIERFMRTRLASEPSSPGH